MELHPPRRDSCNLKQSVIQANFPHQEWENSPSTGTASSAGSGCLAIHLWLAVSPLLWKQSQFLNHAPLSTWYLFQVCESLQCLATDSNSKDQSNVCRNISPSWYATFLWTDPEQTRKSLFNFTHVLQFSLLGKKCATKNICMLPIYYSHNNSKCVWHSRQKKFWLQTKSQSICNYCSIYIFPLSYHKIMIVCLLYPIISKIDVIWRETVLISNFCCKSMLGLRQGESRGSVVKGPSHKKPRWGLEQNCWSCWSRWNTLQ